MLVSVFMPWGAAKSGLGRIAPGPLAVCLLIAFALPAWAQQSDSAITGESANLPASVLPHDLSVWSMFEAADPVVKGVMAALAFASVVTWTIFVAKSVELAGAWRHMH